jgi:hypothetical protein
MILGGGGDGRHRIVGVVKKSDFVCCLAMVAEPHQSCPLSNDGKHVFL